MTQKREREEREREEFGGACKNHMRDMRRDDEVIDHTPEGAPRLHSGERDRGEWRTRGGGSSVGTARGTTGSLALLFVHGRHRVYFLGVVLKAAR